MFYSFISFLSVNRSIYFLFVGGLDPWNNSNNNKWTKVAVFLSFHYWFTFSVFFFLFFFVYQFYQSPLPIRCFVRILLPCYSNTIYYFIQDRDQWLELALYLELSNFQFIHNLYTCGCVVVHVYHKYLSTCLLIFISW